MDALKQWMVCIIFCALICAVINVLSPKGGTERVMKVVVSTFLVCAFLSPFISGSSVDIDFELPDFSEHQYSLSSEITSQMIYQTEQETEKETISLLLSLEVEYISVDAEADVNSENQIYISRITIKAKEEFRHRQKQIEANLKAMFSTEVIFEWVKN